MHSAVRSRTCSWQGCTTSLHSGGMDQGYDRECSLKAMRHLQPPRPFLACLPCGRPQPPCCAVWPFCEQYSTRVALPLTLCAFTAAAVGSWLMLQALGAGIAAYATWQAGIAVGRPLWILHACFFSLLHDSLFTTAA